MRVLVTGAAGFIGYHLCHRLLAEGHRVLGVDRLGTQDEEPEAQALRLARLTRLSSLRGFDFACLDLARAPAATETFRWLPEAIVHLAARPGVRAGPAHVEACVRDNVVAWTHVLEAAARGRVGHVVFASSSSVYGDGPLPAQEEQPLGRPRGIYAATKQQGESLGAAFARAAAIPVTAARLFSVFGPWGRPDMAPLRFLRALHAGEPVSLHGHGMRRDFTYVEDVAEALARLVVTPPEPGCLRPVNVGRGAPVSVDTLLEVLESATGCRVERVCVPAHPAEAQDTWAECARLERLTGMRPRTPFEVGIRKLVDWYRSSTARATPRRTGSPRPPAPIR